MNEQYEHIADWSHRHEEDIRQHHRYDFDEDVGRGLRFDMLSWKGEAAKRVVVQRDLCFCRSSLCSTRKEIERTQRCCTEGECEINFFWC